MTPVTMPDLQVRLLLNPTSTKQPDSTATLDIDVSAYVWLEQSPLTIRYGRSSELDRFEAGQVSFTLRDPDRRFDPSNTSGPYYPYLRPMARLRVTATWPKTSGTARDLFRGYIDTITPQPAKGLARMVQIRASDAFAVLTLETFTQTYLAGATVHNAIGDILDLIGWSASLRSTSVGTAIFGARTYTNANVLSSIQDLAAQEGGSLLIDKLGRVRTRNRTYRANNRTIRATFGNESDTTGQWKWGSAVWGRASTMLLRGSSWVSGVLSEQQVLSIQAQSDDKLIRNAITVTRSGGTPQTASDSVSQLAYGTRSYSETSSLETDSAALDRANYLKGRYKDPQHRIKQIQIRGDSNPSVLWPLIVNTGLGGVNTLDVDSLIRVTDRIAPGQMGTLQQDVRIEGIEHQISAQNWLTTYRTSPEQNWWILEDAVYGVLERSTTRIGW